MVVEGQPPWNMRIKMRKVSWIQSKVLFAETLEPAAAKECNALLASLEIGIELVRDVS